MGNNAVIKKDVYEAFLKNNDTGRWYFVGLTTKADTQTKVNSDLIRGGIGNGIIAQLYYTKDVTIDITTSIHYDDVYSIQEGNAFRTGGFAIPKNLAATITGNSFTLPGIDVPVGNVVVVEDINGIQSNGTFNPANRTVTTTGLADGAVTVFYTETEANAQILDISKDKFPINHELWLHSIIYKKNGKLLANTYRHYYATAPDGNVNDTAEAGKNNTDSFKLTALVDDTTGKYGEYVVIPVSTTSSLASPTLVADSTGNAINSAIDITFTDDATWRGAITQILVNSVQIPVSDITLTSGKITLVGTLFPTAGTYNIVVVAGGYTNSTVNQTITAV